MARLALSHLSFEAEERALNLREDPPFPGKWVTETLEPWGDFERRLEYASAYDGTREPKNYGVHNAELHLVLIGEHGAITAGLSTGWDLPHVIDRSMAQERDLIRRGHGGLLHGPTGLAICHHSPTPPRYWSDDADDWAHEEPAQSCEYLGGRPCYSDCGYVAGDNFAVALIGDGWWAAWELLREWYDNTFLKSDGTHYHGRVYTGFNSRTEAAPLWSERTRGHLELERERRQRRKERC